MRRRGGFLAHLAVYVIVNAFLTFINFYTRPSICGFREGSTAEASGSFSISYFQESALWRRSGRKRLRGLGCEREQGAKSANRNATVIREVCCAKPMRPTLREAQLPFPQPPRRRPAR
ncbi:2TM domain-containing protein [Candidatus Alkanophaga liquidiphilum]